MLRWAIPSKLHFCRKGDQPAHFYFGDQKFTPDQHGNNCLIQAVLTGIGHPEMDAHEVRKEIAKACMTEGHPSHDYIKRGIARNYVKIGLVGGGEPLTFTIKDGKIEYEGRMSWEFELIDEWLYNDWKNIASEYFKRKFKVKLRKGDKRLENLSGVADDGSELHRCHRLSEKSLITMLVNAVNSDDKEKGIKTLELLLDSLYPEKKNVEEDSSVFTLKLKGQNGQVFSEDSPSKDLYLSEPDEIIFEQRNKIIKLIDHSSGEDVIMNEGELVGAMEDAAKALSHSPANLSLGDGSTNSSIKEYMDYNPGTPRSENLLHRFKDVDGFIGYIKEGNQPYTSFFHGEKTTRKIDGLGSVAQKGYDCRESYRYHNQVVD